MIKYLTFHSLFLRREPPPRCDSLVAVVDSRAVEAPSHGLSIGSNDVGTHPGLAASMLLEAFSTVLVCRNNHPSMTRTCRWTLQLHRRPRRETMASGRVSQTPIRA